MRRQIMAVTAALLAVLSAIPGQAQPYDGDYWYPMWVWGHMIFGGLMMIVFWGSIVVLIVLLVRWLGGASHSGRGAPPPSRQAPLEILQERFAKGDIDKDEYEERRKLLSS